MTQHDATARPTLVNPFEQDGSWFKANLHCHTTTSDGDTPLEPRIRQYRDHGYNILAVTDHDRTNDVAKYSAKNFLVISGMETHPPCLVPGEIYHLVCLNVPLGFACPEGADANERVAMVRRAGGEVIYAHPYWCGHRNEHILPVRDFIAIEVFNSTCTRIGKGCSSVHWDNLLDVGRNVPAVAVDDVHGGRDIFMGWTMIKARELNVNSVLSALRTGCFYASCGPTIEDFRVRDGKVFLKCSPVAEIHFMAQRYVGASTYADDGPDMTWAECPVDKTFRYVRGEVVDRQGRRAWTNPIFIQ